MMADDGFAAAARASIRRAIIIRASLLDGSIEAVPWDKKRTEIGDANSDGWIE